MQLAFMLGSGQLERNPEGFERVLAGGQLMKSLDRFDAIVVGGGPSGATMAWSLASRGIKVAVLERSTFPREKVCGDFVEPAGLRIIENMGCSGALGLGERPAISKVRAYYGTHIAYQNDVAYYEGELGMPPHGHVIPRDQLDTA
ncbi:MAG: FAD-dependent oxidoreductase, partial [Pontixanthobacter sp.]